MKLVIEFSRVKNLKNHKLLDFNTRSAGVPKAEQINWAYQWPDFMDQSKFIIENPFIQNIVTSSVIILFGVGFAGEYRGRHLIVNTWKVDFYFVFRFEFSFQRQSLKWSAKEWLQNHFQSNCDQIWLITHQYLVQLHDSFSFKGPINLL